MPPVTGEQPKAHPQAAVQGRTTISGPQAGGGPNSSTALRPPKANEFDMA